MLFSVKVDSPTYSICLFYKHLSKNNNFNHSLLGGTIQNTTKGISNSSFCIEYVMNYLSFVRLKDVSTLYFSNPSFNPPGPFNPRIFNHELFNPRLFNHEFLNYGVEKFMVEKAGIEMSFNLIERWYFNPGLFKHEFLIHWVEKFKVQGWSMGLKSPGWRCPSTFCQCGKSN